MLCAAAEELNTVRHREHVLGALICPQYPEPTDAETEVC